MENNQNISRFDINTKGGRKRRHTISGKLLHKVALVFQVILGIIAMLYGLTLIIGAFGVLSVPGVVDIMMYLIDEFMGLGMTFLVYYFLLKPLIHNRPLRWIATFVAYLVCVYTSDGLGAYFVYGLRFLTGAFGIITGFLLLLNAARQIRDGVNFVRSLIWGIIYLAAGIYFFLAVNNMDDFVFIFGFYIFTFAYNYTKESFKALLKVTSKVREGRRKVVTLPTFISAFLPMGFFTNLNSTVSRDDYDKSLFLNEGEENQEEMTDLTVYIHTRAGFMPGFGHVDISFDGKVYCYGNYDEATWLFGGFLSDGVLATTTPENHIKNALTNDKKVLVAYDLKISEKTKEKIKKQIEKMMDKAYRWKPKAELAAEGQIEGNPEDYTDVASRMYLEENTELYKFKKGSPYKTYYLLGQNCAMVANEIVGHSGIKLLRLNRIVTPGSYLEYLDQLYNLGHTIVVNRNIYMLNDAGRPYLLSKENEEDLGKKIPLKEKPQSSEVA